MFCRYQQPTLFAIFDALRAGTGLRVGHKVGILARLAPYL